MLKSRHIHLAAALLLAATSARPARAQKTIYTGGGGIFIGGAVHAARLHTSKYVSDTSARTAFGAGGQIRIGWENPVITPFIGYDIAHVPRSNGSYKFKNVDYGARVRLPFLSRFLVGGTPYVEGAITNPTINQSHVKVEGRDYTPRPNVAYNVPFPEVSSEGIMKTLGAGLTFRNSQHRDIDIGFDITRGTFDSVRFSGGAVGGWNFSATTARFHVGINWHPYRT